MNLAQRITTPAEGDDSTLEPQILSKIEDFSNSRRLKPGFRILFHGPSGTDNKTLAAALLGKGAGLPVFRVDLSRILPEWTEETEQSLAGLFAEAELQGWILFFDGADLFDKRTESRNANDRAANQQIAYLLQRIEDFPGIVILGADLGSHLDEEFAGRFQEVLHFPVPGRLGH
jgi:SpoVK/Ycf46/Vps4 family AAA+-type ATPase